MAFPAVVGTPQDSTSTSQVTSHTINVNSPANGDLLLLVVHFKTTGQTITWPVGKTMTQVGRLPQSTNNETVVFYRFCDGAEGATITMTTSATTRMVARAWRFTGHHTSSAPEAAFFVYGAVNNPNPPSLTPSWGAADTQWITTFGNNNGTETVSAFPTNYTSTGAATTGSSTGATLGYGLRQLNAASEDPGTFTKSATANGVASTIAIRPGGASDQTITAGSIPTDEALYGLAVTPSQVTLSAGAVPAAEALYGPSTTLTVSAGSLPTAEDVYGSTVSPGARGVSAGSILTAQDAYGPVVTPGSASLDAGAIPTAQELYGPALTPGGVVLDAGAIPTSESAYGPATGVEGGLQPLSAGSIPTAESLYGAFVTPGEISVSAGSIASSEVLYGPGLVPGGVAVEAGAMPTSEVLYGMAVQGPLQTVSVGAIATAEALYGPAVFESIVGAGPVYAAVTVAPKNRAAVRSGVLVQV